MPFTSLTEICCTIFKTTPQYFGVDVLIFEFRLDSEAVNTKSHCLPLTEIVKMLR